MGSEWILGDWLGGVDSVGSGQGPVTGFCERGDEPLGSGTTELVKTMDRIQKEIVHPEPIDLEGRMCGPF
jgi:hypothetical protein